jgi:hypothetical protein
MKFKRARGGPPARSPAAPCHALHQAFGRLWAKPVPHRYVTNITRMQVMWQALFDISNPILHTAKALNASGVKAVKSVKWVVFIL